MKTLSMWLAFAVAMWAIGSGWAALRAAWSRPSPDAVAVTTAHAVVLVGALLYLGYWIYAADRAAGKVRRPIALYEWLLKRR